METLPSQQIEMSCPRLCPVLGSLPFHSEPCRCRWGDASHRTWVQGDFQPGRMNAKQQRDPAAACFCCLPVLAMSARRKKLNPVLEV